MAPGNRVLHRFRIFSSRVFTGTPKMSPESRKWLINHYYQHNGSWKRLFIVTWRIGTGEQGSTPGIKVHVPFGMTTVASL